MTAVLGAPSFNEAHSDGAHARQLINGFESLADRLRQQRRKFLVVEDLQITTRGDFTNGSGMPSVTLVTIGGLNKNGRVAEAFGKNLSADVVEADAFANMTSRLFHDRITVDVGQ